MLALSRLSSLLRIQSGFGGFFGATQDGLMSVRRKRDGIRMYYATPVYSGSHEDEEGLAFDEQEDRGPPRSREESGGVFGRLFYSGRKLPSSGRDIGSNYERDTRLDENGPLAVGDSEGRKTDVEERIALDGRTSREQSAELGRLEKQREDEYAGSTDVSRALETLNYSPWRDGDDDDLDDFDDLAAIEEAILGNSEQPANWIDEPEFRNFIDEEVLNAIQRSPDDNAFETAAPPEPSRSPVYPGRGQLKPRTQLRGHEIPSVADVIIRDSIKSPDDDY